MRSSQGGAYSGRRVVQEQESQLAFAVDDLAQNLLRHAIDPVQILDHHEDRREPAARLQQLHQKLARAQADQDTVEPRQRTIGDFEAKQMQQQTEVSGRVKTECGQPPLQFLRDVLLRFAGANPERAAHHFDEGKEGCLLAVGRAASRQDEDAVIADALAELVQEARLAHARLGHDIDNAESRACLDESAF